MPSHHKNFQSALAELKQEYQLLKQHPDLTGTFILLVLLKFPEALISITKNADKVFFDTRDFPWVQRLEDSWRLIRKELEVRLRAIGEIPNFQDVQSEQRLLTDDDKWKTYVFYAYGKRVERNCNECPHTAGLLDTIPGMTSAMFSILGAHKELPAHRGPYKGVLRYHLALKVPEPAESCGIRVHGEIRHWQEGESLVFDDTYEHEAWNRTNQTRVVLFVDFLRPLPAALSWLNKAVVRAIGSSRFISKVFQNLDDWHQKIEKLKAG